MASRAVPVLRHWPGAETIYDMRWIHRGPAQMAAAIMAHEDEAAWRAAGDEAHAQAAAAFGLDAGVRGLARPAHHRPGPGGARTPPRAARLPLTGMYFTLAISAATRQRCAALVSAAQDTDPRVMPIPGPARVGWQAPDERTAVLHWGAAGLGRPASHAGNDLDQRPPRPSCGPVPAWPASTRCTWPRCRARWWSVIAPAGPRPSPAASNGHDPVMVGAFLSRRLSHRRRDALPRGPGAGRRPVAAGERRPDGHSRRMTMAASRSGPG